MSDIKPGDLVTLKAYAYTQEGPTVFVVLHVIPEDDVPVARIAFERDGVILHDSIPVIALKRVEGE